MSELTEFLLARIAEDELSALVASNNPKWSWASVDFNSSDAAQFGHRFDPARVLRECEAKRRIVGADAEADQIAGAAGDGSFTYKTGRSDGLDTATRILASVYADHPDYDPAWAV